MANEETQNLGVLCLDASSVGYSIEASLRMIDDFRRDDITGELNRLSGVLRSTLTLAEKLSAGLENSDSCTNA